MREFPTRAATGTWCRQGRVSVLGYAWSCVFALALTACPGADQDTPAGEGGDAGKKEPAASAAADEPDSGAGFQADADVRRLVHLQHYAELIEAYHEATGRYPLQGRSPRRLEVFVSNPDQREQMERWTARGDPRNPSDRAPFSDLVAELAKGLGREVPEYYDPQIVATVRPNFYIYLVTADAYFFAVHVSRAYPFAQEVGAGVYKIEVGSSTDRLRPEVLFERDDFQAAVTRPLTKPELFDARDQKYLHATVSGEPSP